jgi:hypothetical protein
MCVGFEHDVFLFLELCIFVHALPRFDCDCDCLKVCCSRPTVSWRQNFIFVSKGVTKPVANASGAAILTQFDLMREGR